MLFAAVTGWVTHLRWWCWRRWCIIFKHWNSFGMMVTHLAWTPYWHSSQPWPPLCNLLLLHPQTERPLLLHIFPFLLNTTTTVLLVENSKDGIFASGNATCHYKYLWNRKRQTSPYYLLHCHAATSVFPLPVGPPIQLHPLSKAPCAFHSRYATMKFVHSSWLHCHTLLQFCLLLFRMDIGSWYRQTPVVPAVPFIHNSMVTYGISRMWHPPSSPLEKNFFPRNYLASASLLLFIW